MNNKEIVKFSLTMICLTLAIAIVILVFCWIFYLLPYDFPGTVGEWITALATLSGGSLTLGGVWWTINNQRIQYEINQKPVLYSSISKIKLTKNIFSIDEKFNISISFPIINYSQYIAIYLKIKESKLMIDEEKIEHTVKLDNKYSIITKDDLKEYKLKFILNNDQINKIKNESFLNFRFDTLLLYENIYGYHSSTLITIEGKIYIYDTSGKFSYNKIACKILSCESRIQDTLL